MFHNFTLSLELLSLMTTTHQKVLLSMCYELLLKIAS